MQLTSNDTWLTRAELADRLKVAEKTLAQWGSRKGPRFAKIGGSVRYRMSDVIAWEDAQFGGAA